MDTSKIDGLALYQYDTCPFCMRVRQVVQGLGLEIELRDTVRNGEYAAELMDATGGRTVPVLRIEEPDGQIRWLPESREIIDYLLARFGSSEARPGDSQARPGDSEAGPGD